MRCVVVGSGSAGRRHLAALRARLPTAELVVVRRSVSTQPMAPLEAVGAVVVTDLDQALERPVDLGIVAGPAPGHVAVALALLDASATVLVEKPVAADPADGRRLLDASGVERVVVGYHLRFDDVVRAFDGAVASAGGADEVVLEVGQHLGSWRPGTDAARSVSARRELGGGVLLELSHEIDQAIRMIGPISSVEARLRADGAPTDGTVETVADLELEGADGRVARLHLDMVASPPRRRWRAEVAGGAVAADLLAGVVEAPDAPGASIAAGWRDRAELALLDHLIEVHEGRATPRCTVLEAVEVLDVVDAARRSAQRGGAVAMRPCSVGGGGWT